MRRGVWVVLGLVMAPVGVLAQDARGQPAEQARVPEQVSNEALQQQINELWQGYRLLQQELAALREEIEDRQAAPAVGGSGQAGGAPAVGGSGQAGGAPAVGGSGQAGGAPAVGGSRQAGGAPTMGGAGQAGTAAEEEDDSGLIIVEMPEREDQGSSGRLAGQSGAPQTGSATGGSGLNTGGQEQAAVTSEQVFLGRVRSVTEDRLLMVDPNGRVFELGLSEQTLVIGPGGASASLRALKEGTPVRTVAREGEMRSQVLLVQVLAQAPKPSR